MKARLLSVTPLIPAGPSIADALEFYVHQLGFQVLWQDANMAGIARDNLAFNLVRNTEQAWIDNTSFSIGVSNLEALYDEYRNAPAQVGPLELKPWGRTEFHMIVPSSACLQFYQEAPAA